MNEKLNVKIRSMIAIADTGAVKDATARNAYHTTIDATKDATWHMNTINKAIKTMTEDVKCVYREIFDVVVYETEDATNVALERALNAVFDELEL